MGGEVARAYCWALRAAPSARSSTLAFCDGNRECGAPAPFDAPRFIVAAGTYRHARNPLYIGCALLLPGLGLDQRAPSIVLFVPAWWVLFHLLVILYEEPMAVYYLAWKYGVGFLNRTVEAR